MTDFHLVWNVLPDLSVVIVQVEKEVLGCLDLQRTELHSLGLSDIFDGQMFALGDDVLDFAQILSVEHRLHLIHYYIYKALAKQGHQ